LRFGAIWGEQRDTHFLFLLVLKPEHAHEGAASGFFFDERDGVVLKAHAT